MNRGYTNNNPQTSNVTRMFALVPENQNKTEGAASHGKRSFYCYNNYISLSYDFSTRKIWQQKALKTKNDHHIKKINLQDGSSSVNDPLVRN